MISIIGSPAQFSQQLLGGVSGQPGNNGGYAPDNYNTIIIIAIRFGAFIVFS